MSKTTAWLIVVGGMIINILAGDYLHEIVTAVINGAIGVGILGTLGYVNRRLVGK